MTISLALDYIPRRMKELGYADNYSIQFRHFVLSAKQKIKVHAQNHFFILVEPNDSVAVRSGTGIYDLTIDNANELQYEHQGEIRIRNYSIVTQHARFIQVIPNENKQCQ